MMAIAGILLLILGNLDEFVGITVDYGARILMFGGLFKLAGMSLLMFEIFRYSLGAG